MSNLPTVVIIGRRNVGKSALFNRLLEQNKAIISDIEGTTRDRTEGTCRWSGNDLRVIDTGGLDVGDDNTIDREIKKQTRFAIKKADLILFLTDTRVGPQPADRLIAKELYQAFTPSNSPSKRGRNNQISPPARGGVRGGGSKTPVFLVANKAETDQLRQQAQDPRWKTLKLGLPIAISALTGQGVGDLLDLAVKKLPITNYQLPIPIIDLKIAIIGKPNVGKSSLLNKILGEERVIVSPTAHTTREPQDTLITIPDPRSTTHEERQVLLIDTAGIRKKPQITPGIENAGVAKTLTVIKQADVVLFVLDTAAGIDVQDKHLAGMINEIGVGVIIIANKWDLLQETKTNTQKKQIKEHDTLLKVIHYSLPGITFAPIVFTSALNGHNVHKLLALALEVHKNRQQKISKNELETLLPKLILYHRPVKSKGTIHPVIKRIKQIGTSPPTFKIIIGYQQTLHHSYLKYLENRLREFYNFTGSPIKIIVEQSIQPELS